MLEFSFNSVVLALGTSRDVVLIVSTSYPLTYALPGEICKDIKSSEGVIPDCVC